MKALSRDDVHRPRDISDLRVLCLSANEEERELAQSGAELVVQRGYGRDRDLRAHVAGLLALYPYDPDFEA